MHCLIGALVVVVDVFINKNMKQEIVRTSPCIIQAHLCIVGTGSDTTGGHNMYYNMYYNMHNTYQHVLTCNRQLQCRPVSKQETSRPCMADNTAGVKGSGSCDRAFLGDDANGAVVWVAG